MKLNRDQIDAIVNEIVKESRIAQENYKKENLVKETKEWIKDFKKSLDYALFLKLEEIKNFPGVNIQLNKKSGIYLREYFTDMIDLELMASYNVQELIKQKIPVLSCSFVKAKLVIATIKNFDLQEFKKEILKTQI